MSDKKKALKDGGFVKKDDTWYHRIGVAGENKPVEVVEEGYTCRDGVWYKCVSLTAIYRFEHRCAVPYHQEQSKPPAILRPGASLFGFAHPTQRTTSSTVYLPLSPALLT